MAKFHNMPSQIEDLLKEHNIDPDDVMSLEFSWDGEGPGRLAVQFLPNTTVIEMTIVTGKTRG